MERGRSVPAKVALRGRDALLLPRDLKTGRTSFLQRDMATTSLSHVLVLTQLCFFEMARMGTKVEGPTAAKITPLVHLLSDLSPAKSASQNKASLQFTKSSPT